jgi:hypothetical protein
MSFMQPVTYHGRYRLFETTAGTELIPADVCDSDDPKDYADCLEGKFKDDELPEAVEGYYGRYSAPGYMDCTSWHRADSEEALLEELNELYGADPDDDCAGDLIDIDIECDHEGEPD